MAVKVYAPSYYKHFRCIAGECKNSCCIGWEIDIDAEALARYSNVGGEFGKRLEKCIDRSDVPHFILERDERCPFLNSGNLCDIYTELGEENLCQICSDHPRFRNFFPDRIETGLGMCCEAAAELILKSNEPFALESIGEAVGDDTVNTGTESFFLQRGEIFELIFRGGMSMEEKIEALMTSFGVYLPEKTFDEWADIYLSLEILDDCWRTLLINARGLQISEAAVFEAPQLQNALCQMLAYFVFRHMYTGWEQNDIPSYLAFCILSLRFICGLVCAAGDISVDALCRIARMYSAEIEYSTENIDELIFEMEI